MRSIKEAKDLKGKKVLVRVDWSVLMEKGEVLDDYQIQASLPTLRYLQEVGVSHVSIITHLESKEDSIESLLMYVPEDMELLPNLRKNPGEESNSLEFAKELAKKFDLYINDAFPVSHREHASVVSVPKLLPSYAGLRFVEEVENLSKAFHPPHQFLLLLGGAKFETKLPLVEKFITIADNIFIGGVMAREASETLLAKDAKVMLPTGDLSALDSNEKTLSILQEKINKAKFIIWNGPLGKYEEGYKEGTEHLANMLASSSAEVIVGGGDTLTSIKDLNILDKFSFVSTGGGAMLTFLATGTLPGIKALGN